LRWQTTRFTITQAAGAPDPNAVVLSTVKNAASYQTGGVSPDQFVVLVAGVFQVNVTVPNATPSGSVPLVVQVGLRTSQTGVTVSVQ
jgi:hypothetical protein